MTKKAVKIAGIVLAAGDGIRMNSHLPKVLNKVGSKPLVYWATQALVRAGINRPVITVSRAGPLIKKILGQDYIYIFSEPLGTGWTVLKTQPFFAKKMPEHIIVINGDTPLFQPQTVKGLIQAHLQGDSHITMVTVVLPHPTGYGRIIRDSNGLVVKTIEDKDATAKEKQIKEINAGLYCFQAPWIFTALKKVKKSASGEYYLTEVIKMAVETGKKVSAFKINDYFQALGVNTQKQLEEVQRVFIKRKQS